MKDEDFIGNRAMNDYTADNPKKSIKKEEFVEPKKVAMCIWSNSANEPIDRKKKK